MESVEMESVDRLHRDRESKTDAGKNLLLNGRSVIARDGSASMMVMGS